MINIVVYLIVPVHERCQTYQKLRLHSKSQPIEGLWKHTPCEMFT